MKEHYSAAELSKSLDISARAVGNRARNEGWKFINGKRRVYLTKSLPRDVRRKIISHQIGCALDFIPSKKIDVSRAEVGLKKWNKATEYNRKRAQAEDYILDKLSEFIKSKNLKQIQGEERFEAFYNAGLIKVEPWILEKISRVSAPSLRRWRGEKAKHGLPGLLGKHGNRKGQSTAFTPEHRAFTISHIMEKPHIRPVHIFKLLCKTFEVHPSKRTVYRFIKKWKKENLQLSTLIEDPRRWKNSHMAAFGNAGADVPHFGHTWEIDSTPADVITKDDQRNAVVCVLSVYSRRAIVVIAPTSKALVIAATMRKAMIAWGVPSRIRMDNGADYQSSHVQAICNILNIHTPELPKYSPEKKPFVERFLGTYSRGFEELLPGYCGHSVNERQALREKETWANKIMKPGGSVEVPLTMEEFQNLTDRWIKIYENTPHKGLDGKTPLEVAKKSFLQPQKIRNERRFDVLLAHVAYRTVQKKGISVDNSFFVSPELVEYIGRRVEIRRDLNNAGLLYVFDASGENYLCQARNEPLEGQSLEDYQTAKKEHFKGIKGVKRALEKMGASNKTAIQTLLEDEIEHDESNVIPFQGNFENPAVEEARKALLDIDAVNVDEAPEQVSRAVNYYSSMDFLLDDSHMTEEDFDREVQELKECRHKKLKPIH